MKNASPELKALLATGEFQKADLYTLTLSGGLLVRWSAADIELSYGGQPFLLGPIIKRGPITDKMGLEASTLEMTISARDDTLVNGVPLIQFIKNRGLDGANLKLERVFMPDWKSPITGGVIRFSGKVTSVGDIAGSSCKITVTSWSILLNVNYPPNVYQAGCIHSLYDQGCTLNKASFKSSLIVSSTSPTTSSFRPTTSPQASGYWSQGFLTFTSGANNGLQRTVRSWDGTTLEVIPPLPVAPAAGDTFDIYAGCDLTHGTCLNKFNNLIHFKGTPFVPIPETAV